MYKLLPLVYLFFALRGEELERHLDLPWCQSQIRIRNASHYLNQIRERNTSHYLNSSSPSMSHDRAQSPPRSSRCVHPPHHGVAR